jgi:hypothetical protein
MLQGSFFLSKNIKIMEYAMSNVGTPEEIVVGFPRVERNILKQALSTATSCDLIVMQEPSCSLSGVCSAEERT